VSIRDPEQLRADIGRWSREIRTWRAAGLTDEHPNIKRRLNRIALAQHFLDQLAALILTHGGKP
jgi:hypothetical protein